MDDTIKELYRHREKSFERQMKVVDNRLQFVTWLFGIASATLFSALAVIRTSEPSEVCFLLKPEAPALVAGLLAFLGLFFTYKAKMEGNISLEGLLKQLTILDIQAAATLDENQPELTQHQKVLKFMRDEYLEENTRSEMDTLNKLYDREHSELYWQSWLFKAVVASLIFLFISIILDVI